MVDGGWSDEDGVMVYFCIRDHRSLGGGTGTGKHERRRDTRLHPLNPPICTTGEEEPSVVAVLRCAGACAAAAWSSPLHCMSDARPRAQS